MKNGKNNSIRASALQIALAAALLSSSAILVAGSFTPQSPEGNSAVTEATAPEWSSSETPVQIFPVTNTNDSGAGSLRDAITQANGMPGADMITFNISGMGVHTIRPLSPLPTITNPVTIDGYTQLGTRPNTNPPTMGSNAVLLIEIDGNDQNMVGLVVASSASGSRVRGLVMNRFSGNPAIRVQGSSMSVIEGNFIGTDPTGTTARPNGIGVDLRDSAAINTIGGTSPAARNLISGNTNNIGVRIDVNSSGNIVQGNLIGTNAAGTAPLPNGDGVQVGNNSTNTIIGGDTEAARNVIIANLAGHSGINVSNTHSGVMIRGNFINTDVTGTTRLDPGGATAITMLVTTGVTIGGITATPGMPPGNLLVGGNAGNLGYAITGQQVSSVTIQGNMIGSDITGTVSLGGGKGITLPGGSGLIGGTTPGTGNVIARHASSGIDNVLNSTETLAVLRNSIHSNGSLGIDWVPVGAVTPNDSCDSNYPQNFPIITSISFGGGMVTVSGTLNSVPSTMFRLEFFSSAQGDASGNGEGQTFLGSANRVTNGSCNASFGPLSFPVPPSQRFVTATATRLDAMGNPIETSEFAAFLAGPQPSPTPTPTPTATPARSRLRNLSTRSFVQTGDNVMIGGFIVHGTGPKRVIIRAIGPELTQFGVPNVLADPTLELHNGAGALIARNDNWQHTIIGGIITHDQVQEIQNSGLAPGDMRESAIIAELPAGNYTAIVRGTNTTVGVALVEVYDLALEAPPILFNISTRSFVQTGDNVMIGGFIVHGTGHKRVIIRAIGPELSQFGVPGPLQNPTLELHNGPGALIGSNDNWRTTIIGGVITHDQVQEIRNSGLAPGDGRESAIIAELPPGNYTAIVRGVNSTTGVALVEVYDLD